MTDTPLRESQAVAILWALEHPRSGLFLPMGFGKTRLVIEALDFLDWPRTLVVAPKRVAEDVWTSELPRWAPGVRFSLVAGPPQKRLDALATPAQVYIISRDNLAWLVNDGLKKLRRMLHQKRTPHYEAIIIDELSSFKSRESNRFKALNALTNNANPPAGACNTWRALYAGIAQLNDDLINHIHLENNVLFPQFEAAVAEQGSGSGCGCAG